MAKQLLLDTSITDAGMPTLEMLEDYEASITALSPYGWWDASNSAYRTDVAGKCSQLTDRTGHGHHMVQATGGNQPPISAAAFGTLNGVARDGLTFDGATDSYMLSDAFFDGSTVWSSAYYGKFNAAASIRVPLSTNNAGGTYSMGHASGALFQTASGTCSIASDPAIPASVAAIAGHNYSGVGNESIYLEINGTNHTTSQAYNAGHFPANGDKLQLGGYELARSFKMNGLISEIILFKSDVTTVGANLTMLRAYFAFKYRAS